MQNFVYKSLKNEERQFTLILSWTITSFFAVACENNKSIKRCKFSHTLQASWLGIASVSTSTFSSLSVSPPLSSLALRWLSKKLVCRPLTDWTRTTDTFLGVMWCKRDTTSAWQPLPTKHSTSARSAKTRFTDVDTCHTKKAFGVLKARPAAVNRMLIVLFMDGGRHPTKKVSTVEVAATSLIHQKGAMFSRSLYLGGGAVDRWFLMPMGRSFRVRRPIFHATEIHTWKKYHNLCGGWCGCLSCEVARVPLP